MLYILLSISLFLSIISLYGIVKVLNNDNFNNLSINQIIFVWLLMSISWGIYSYLL